MRENTVRFPSRKNNTVGGVFLAENPRKDVSLFSLSSANPLFLLIFACSPLQRLKSGDHFRLPD